MEERIPSEILRFAQDDIGQLDCFWAIAALTNFHAS